MDEDGEALKPKLQPATPPKAKVLKRERFQLSRPGPRRALWLEIAPGTGCSNSKERGIVVLDVLEGVRGRHRLMPYQVMLPFKSTTLEPPTILELPPLTLIGSPDSIVMIPDTAQPPSQGLHQAVRALAHNRDVVDEVGRGLVEPLERLCPRSYRHPSYGLETGFKS